MVLLEKCLLDAVDDELDGKGGQDHAEQAGNHGRDRRAQAFGVNAFGPCGDSITLYDHYQTGADAILRAAKRWD